MENYLGNLENKIKDTKVMILLGDGIVDGRNRDGEVDIMMKQKNEDEDRFYYHAVCLSEYLQDHFKDCKDAQEADRSSANSLLYALTEYNAIPVAETTSPKHGNSILFFMPHHISKKQAENLRALKGHLISENYELQILYDLHKNEYGIGGRQIIGDSNALDGFIKQGEKEQSQEPRKAQKEEQER